MLFRLISRITRRGPGPRLRGAVANLAFPSLMQQPTIVEPQPLLRIFSYPLRDDLVDARHRGTDIDQPVVVTGHGDLRRQLEMQPTAWKPDCAGAMDRAIELSGELGRQGLVQAGRPRNGRLSAR